MTVPHLFVPWHDVGISTDSPPTSINLYHPFLSLLSQTGVSVARVSYPAIQNLCEYVTGRVLNKVGYLTLYVCYRWMYSFYSVKNKIIVKQMRMQCEQSRTLGRVQYIWCRMSQACHIDFIMFILYVFVIWTPV